MTRLSSWPPASTSRSVTSKDRTISMVIQIVLEVILTLVEVYNISTIYLEVDSSDTQRE
jgi:spore germination protein GerM